MKKQSILLLLCSIALLSGCGSSTINDSTGGSTPIDTSDTGGDTKPSTGGDTTPVEDNTTTVTSPAGFAKAFSAGYQFDVTEGSQDLLKNAIDPEGKIISSIETKKVTIQGHEKKDEETELELTVGTGKYGGALTFNTLVPLKSISFQLQAYSKWFAYTGYEGYSRDYPTVYINDGNEKVLTVVEEGENPIEEYTVSFDSETTKVVISGEDDAAKRFFIKSVSFTFAE